MARNPWKDDSKKKFTNGHIVFHATVADQPSICQKCWFQGFTLHLIISLWLSLWFIILNVCYVPQSVRATLLYPREVDSLWIPWLNRGLSINEKSKRSIRNNVWGGACVKGSGQWTITWYVKCKRILWAVIPNILYGLFPWLQCTLKWILLNLNEIHYTKTCIVVLFVVVIISWMSTGMSSTCRLTDAKLYRMINQSSLVDVGAQRG